MSIHGLILFTAPKLRYLEIVNFGITLNLCLTKLSLNMSRCCNALSTNAVGLFAIELQSERSTNIYLCKRLSDVTSLIL